MLKAAVAAFLELVGPTGAVGRWGGDEFVLLVPARSRADALRCAEDIRHAVADLVTVVDRPDSTVTITGVTASVGVAIIGAAGLTSGLWTADAALYAAKRAGGNTVRSAWW